MKYTRKAIEMKEQMLAAFRQLNDCEGMKHTEPRSREGCPRCRFTIVQERTDAYVTYLEEWIGFSK